MTKKEYALREKQEQDNFVEISEKVLLLTQSIEYMRSDIKEIKDKLDNKLDNKYVSKEEFITVKTIVYGQVALILIAVVGALLALVLKG